MGFSIRDGHRRPNLLSSQSGQGIVEYILVLIVTVGLVLGGIYQLNTAFKSWANNYFADYLACLLETGELPNVDGAPGDSGICNQLFQPFDLANGRPPLKMAKGNVTGGSSNGRGNRENRPSGPGGAAGNYLPMPNFNGSRSGGHGGAGSGRGGSDSAYTGSTSATGYGSNLATSSNSGSSDSRNQLDQSFAFDTSAEKTKRQNFTPTRKSASADEFANKTHFPFPKTEKKPPAQPEDSPLTFGNFIRFLIIAAIVIALVMFLGGQMLQITKSME